MAPLDQLKRCSTKSYSTGQTTDPSILLLTVTARRQGSSKYKKAMKCSHWKSLNLPRHNSRRRLHLGQVGWQTTLLCSLSVIEHNYDPGIEHAWPIVSTHLAMQRYSRCQTPVSDIGRWKLVDEERNKQPSYPIMAFGFICMPF